MDHELVTKFQKFLIYNKAFDEYFNNCNIQGTSLDADFWTINPNMWITSAFISDKTNEGSQFWLDLSQKWRKELNIPNTEFKGDITGFKPEIKEVDPMYCSCKTPDKVVNYVCCEEFFICLTCKKEKL